MSAIWLNAESDRLNLISDPDSDKWEIDEPITCQWRNKIVIIDKGYKTDLASIPKWAKWLISNDNPKVRRPAVIHDYLCDKKGELIGETFSSIEAAELFYDALRHDGLNRVMAWLMYTAVRIGGPQWSA